MTDFRRRGIIKNLSYALELSEHELLDHLQLQMSPTVVADESVTLDDAPTEDLRAAMRVVCGR